MLAGEVGGEPLHVRQRLSVRAQGRTRANHPQLVGPVVDAESRAESAQQESDLGSSSAAVHVRLVEHQKKLVAVLREPLCGLRKDRAFERPHQHVLEHRVVRDQDVWSMTGCRAAAVNHLLSRQQLAVAWLGVQAPIPVVPGVGLAGLLSRLIDLLLFEVLRVESVELLRRMPAQPLEFGKQLRVHLGVVLEQGSDPFPVLRRVTRPWIRSSTRVHAEGRVGPSAAAAREHGGKAGVTEESA